MTNAQAWAFAGRVIGVVGAAMAGAAIAIQIAGGPLLLPALAGGAGAMGWGALLLTRNWRTP